MSEPTAEPRCQVCTQPTRDAAFVCDDCLDTLHGQLHGLPDLERELDVEITRRSVKTNFLRLVRNGRASAEESVVFNLAASQTLDALRTELTTACRALALDDATLPADTIGAMADWLIRYEQSIPLRPCGPDIVRGIGRVHRRAMAVIDTPPERIYVGKCHCDTDMYAQRDAEVHVCRNPECRLEWSIAELVDYRNQLARDHLMPLAEIALLANIPMGTLKAWIHRSRMHRAGVDLNGQALFRYGDALALREGVRVAV